ncbi:hypothetical protein AFL01nite_17320 [Aeromicrobium flavum]|uniref:Thiamine pyrimidine synthase n=1 Tax=Aeromicrobium flavum TaxID=416568 RepID=A0A512HVE8_9ACTN|nr:ABC transporter substrate-binding protein [Aeromicrobium flavum]GEO89405.1 hypothetical protein AFL01nite_17320 [Aeromicrobium flavum]
MKLSFRRGHAARFAVVLSAAALTLAACGSDSEEDAGSGSGEKDFGALTVQLSWVKNAEFAGEFMADSKGYFADAGFSSVKLNAGPGATENLVASGKADFGLTNAVTAAQVITEEDAPLKIVGTTYQKNPFTILSRKDTGDIATPADLKGKKIGVQAGGNEILFKALLAANDIEESEVTIVPVEYDPAPLVNKEVDGFVAYLTNESILVASQGIEVTNLPMADNGLPFVAESIIATEQTIKDKPDMVKAFLEAEIKGWKDACADLEAGAKLAVDEYGKDLKLDLEKEIEQNTVQCEDLINTDETAENGIFTISDELLAENLKSLAGAGIDVEADDVFDLSLLDELYEEKPDLKG